MNTKIIKRLVILTALLACLGWFAVGDINNQSVMAAPCCNSCPGGGLPNLQDYCQNKCGARSGACFDNCIAIAMTCYNGCDPCGQGPVCSSDVFCQEWGYTACVGGQCVY